MVYFIEICIGVEYDFYGIILKCGFEYLFGNIFRFYRILFG